MRHPIPVLIAFIFAIQFASAGEVTLEDNQLLAAFDSDSGALTRLEDKTTGWVIERRPELGVSFRLFAPLPTRRYNPVYGQKQHATRVEKVSDNQVELQWKDLVSENGGILPMTLTAEVTLTNGTLTFRATLENDSALTVETIDYPYFGDLNAPSRQTEMEARNMGTQSDELYPHFSNQKGYWGVFYPTKSLEAGRSPFCLIQTPNEGIYVEMDAPKPPYRLEYTFEQHPGVISSITDLVPPEDEIGGKTVNLEFRTCHFIFAPGHTTTTLVPIVLSCYQGGWRAGMDLFKQRHPELAASESFDGFDGPVNADADGRLELFGMNYGSSGGGNVWHNWQPAPNVGWAGWAGLGGVQTPKAAAGAVVARNQNGELEVFAVGNNGNVWHVRQAAVNGSWGNWADLGDDGSGVTDLAVAVNADGRLQLFGISTNQILVSNRQRTPGGDWTGWRTVNTTPIMPGYVVGQNANGRLEIFARLVGSNEDIFHLWQNRRGRSWTDAWVDMGGAGSNPRLAVGRNSDGRLQLFAIGKNGSLWSTWQEKPGGNWSDWSQFGDGFVIQPGFVVGQNADGRLEVYAKGGGADADIYHLWQTDPGGDWTTSWADMQGQGFDPQLAVGNNLDGRCQVFAIGPNGDVWTSWQFSPSGDWSDWSDLGGQGTVFYAGQP